MCIYVKIIKEKNWIDLGESKVSTRKGLEEEREVEEMWSHN